MKEIIYTSESDLLYPKQFFHLFRSDLIVSGKLGWRLFQKSLRSQYRQSLLGYFWIFLPPLVTALIWISLSAGKVVNFALLNNSYILYVVTGVFLWQTFVETLNCPLQQISNSKTIITKLKIPHEALIIAGLGEIVFNQLIRFFVLGAILLIFQASLSWTVIFVPLGIFSLMILGLAIGLFLIPLGLLYRDIGNGLGIILQVLFFLTPIIYPVPTEGIISSVIKLNPITPLIVSTRNWLINGELVPQSGYFYVLSASIIILIFSCLIYRLAKTHLIERLSN